MTKPIPIAIPIPSGTVTFLFTDIEGSTKIAQEHRQAWEGLQRRHHAQMQEAMDMHGGHVFHIIGDAFCVAFHTAEAALLAAIEAQRRLAAQDWGQTPIRVRMGMHTGSAQAGSIQDGNAGYSGYSTLARVQRVMSTAYGGQVLVSNTSADLLRDELPDEVSLRDMQTHRLKGLANPERLWQVEAAGLAREFPALQTLNAIPNNLPIQLTSFIGREQETAELKDLLYGSRLVTCTGPGGIGKTRLALQAAAENLEAFPDGVWVTELGSLTDAGRVLPTLASALGLHEGPGRPLEDAVHDHLRGKKLLLLMDNCEHLLDGCARLADSLLRSSADVRILATSQEALGIAGEAVYRVPALSLPDREHLPSPESLSQYDSVRLFIERAQAAKSDFAVTNENAPAVAQVCSRLDGIPLAIELAAARVRGLSAEQISERLDDRFRLLTGGSRTALPRHQTLRAMIEWSYELLSEPEQALFRRLAAFTGDWTLEGAEAICSRGTGTAGGEKAPEPPLEPGDVMDLMLRLVDRSLLSAEERGGRSRFHMLETIRQLAREELARSGAEADARERHLEFFLGFAEASEPRLQGPQALVWLNQLGSEYENLQAALAWAAEAGSAQPPERLARASEHLADVRVLLGTRTLAIPLYQQAIDLRSRTKGLDPWLVAGLHGKIVSTVASLKWAVDVDTLDRLVARAVDSRAKIETLLKEAEGEPPRVEGVRLLAALSDFIGWVQVPANLKLAAEYALRAVETADKLNAPAELATALGALHNVHLATGNWTERLSVSRRLVQIGRDARPNDARGLGLALSDFGDSLAAVGQYAEALRSVQEAEGLARELQDIEMENVALGRQVQCLFRLDRWDEALELDGKLREMQHRYALERIGPACFELAQIASIHAFRGEAAPAAALRREAHAIMTAGSGPAERWNRFEHY